jgi:lipoprotein-anchoring transpeptidase ErfK/SrfK
MRKTRPSRPLVATLFLAAATLATSAASAQSPQTPAASEPQPAAANQPLPAGARGQVLAVQVLLDHSGHSPGVIDGATGGNTVRAIKAFQRANGMAADGRISDALLTALRAGYAGDPMQRYTITAADVAGPFAPVPATMEEQVKLASLGYESPAEGLAEKFHMAQSFLKAITPGADFGRAGTEIMVIVPRKPGLGAEVARIEVDKAASALRAYDAAGALVATFPATIGSSTFPSPDGAMEVTAVAGAPTYHFNPEGRDWGPDKALTIAAGPNNPVGGTWIDLSKAGYGIHGTPDPRLTGCCPRRSFLILPHPLWGASSNDIRLETLPREARFGAPLEPLNLNPRPRLDGLDRKQQSETWQRRLPAISSCRCPPAPPTRRRRSARRLASAASTSWNSASSSTLRRRSLRRACRSRRSLPSSPTAASRSRPRPRQRASC